MTTRTVEILRDECRNFYVETPGARLTFVEYGEDGVPVAGGGTFVTDTEDVRSEHDLAEFLAAGRVLLDYVDPTRMNRCPPMAPQPPIEATVAYVVGEIVKVRDDLLGTGAA